MRKANLTLWICIVVALICATACSSDPSSSDQASPPGAVQSLAATSADGQVSLTWSEVAQATGYTVYYSTEATIDVETAKAAKRFKKAGAATTTTVALLTNGTAYYFAVAATNASGESPLSAVISCTPKAIIVAPATPKAVTAIAANRAYEITLTWEASPDATSYVLYCGSSSGFAPGDPGVRIYTITDATTFVDRNLSPGVTQYYTLVASNLAGNSPACAEVSALTAPAFPSEFSAIPLFNSADLGWKSVVGAASYKLYWSTDRSASITTEGILSAEVPALTTEFVTKTVTSLVNDTEYYFIVTAIGASKLESTGSPAVKCIPAPQQADAPRNLRASASGTTITVTWEPPATGAAETYKLYRSSTSGFAPADNPLVTQSETSYANTGLDFGTTYYYVVLACSATEKNSNPSNEASAITVPVAPTNPARTISREKVALSWTASPAANGYKIYRAVVTEGNAAAITGAQRTLLGTLNDAGAVAYSDTSIVPGVEYSYGIKAFNGAGESEEAVLSALTIPAPSVLSVTQATSEAVLLSWTPSPGATSYKIYWSLSSASTDPGSSAVSSARNSTARNTRTAEESPITISDPHATTYKDATASTTAPTFYTIISCNASGDSEKSNEVSATRCDPIPETPSLLSAKGLTGDDALKILITWKACKDATHYSLYWSTTSPVDTTEANKNVFTDIKENSYTHAALNPGIAYFYAVKAHNATQSSGAASGATAIPPFKSIAPEPMPVRPAIIHRGVSSPVASSDIPFVLNNRLYRVEGCSWNSDIVTATNDIISDEASMLAKSTGVSIVERDRYVPAQDVMGKEGVVTVGDTINAVLPWVIVDKDPNNENVETAFLFVVSGTDLTKLYLYTSTDAKDWKPEGLVYSLPAGAIPNRIFAASIAKTGSGFTMMISRKLPAGQTNNYLALFYEAYTLRGPWTQIPGAHYKPVPTWENYLPNCIYFDAASGYYYLLSYSDLINQPYLSRSKDLIMWTASPFAPIFIPTREDSKKLFYPEAKYSPEQLAVINLHSAKDPILPATALHVRLCEYMDAGTQKVIIEYDNGFSPVAKKPVGSTFEAEYVGTLTDFLSGFFPATPFPSRGWEGIHREYESDVNSKFSANRASYGRIVSIDPGVKLDFGADYYEWCHNSANDPRANTADKLIPLFDGNCIYGWAFHTQIDDPQAVITLPSPKTITGILVYNRNSSVERLFGCTLEIEGADGKWKEYYKFTEKDILTQQTEIDLLGQNVVSKGIRIAKPSGSMHLYHMEIWGG